MIEVVWNQIQNIFEFCLYTHVSHICIHYNLSVCREWPICIIQIRVLNKVQNVLRNLYSGQETRVRTGHGTKDWLKIGKRVHQGCILLSCLFNLYAKYIMWNAGLDEAQAGIKTAVKNINKLSYADDTNLMAESEKELKSESEREWKSWLKTQHSINNNHGIQSHHFVTNRWGNNGNSDRLYFLGFQNPCGRWLQT